MKIKTLAVAALVALFLLPSCVKEDKGKDKAHAPEKEIKAAKSDAPPPDALAKVGDTYITIADYENQLQKFPAKLAETDHGRKYVVTQHVENILIQKEAEAQGIVKDPVILAKIDDYAKRMYKEAILQKIKERQRQVTDEDAKKYFLENKHEFTQPDRARVSIIELDLDKEKLANEIYGKIKAGKNFEELAREHSKHLTAKRGGDMGFIAPGQFKHLTDVAFKIKVGEVSKPFKSAFGWHIVKVTEFRKGTDISDEEGTRRAKARMEAIEVSKAFDTLMQELKSKHEITIYDEKIKAMAPPPPEAPVAPTIPAPEE